MKQNYQTIITLTVFLCTGTTASYYSNTKPPMGWSTWLVMQCYTHCSNSENHPLCYTENNIKKIAEVMLSEGYFQAGYEFIILDDCWQNTSRNEYGTLMADPKRFPSQIPGLAQYLHSRGLKIGIFSNLAATTGQGFPGSYQYLYEDASTFANWDVDYVKMSSAGTEPHVLDSLYTDFGKYLKSFGKQITYAVSWPVYKTFNQLPVNYNAVKAVANTWRFYGDMKANWQTLLQIMDYYADNQSELINVAEPGAWNDPDVLAIGNNLLTVDQSQAQMAIWCIMSAPLIISSDLRNIGSEYKAILLNREAIAINQDILAKPGYKFMTKTDVNVDVWVRKISPSSNDQYSYALAFINRNAYAPVPFTIDLTTLDLKNPEGYNVKDIFNPFNNPTEEGISMSPTDQLHILIKPMGVMFYQAKIKTPTSMTRSIHFPTVPEIIYYRH